MKKVKYNETSIDQLPNDKPVLYRIETETGNLNYTGIAKRGRVRDRIKEHLGKIPGANVNIEQFSSINDARNKEKNVIKRNQPKYNGQTKNLDECLGDHEKELCAKRHSATHIHAHLTSGGESIRKAEEKDLILRWQPPCNEQLVD